MVIFEGSITYRVFSDKLESDDHTRHDNIIFGLAKVCAGTMFAYLFLKILLMVHEQQWSLLTTPMGTWYLFEILGFVLLPMMLFIIGMKWRFLFSVKIASILTLVGIILNRLNITIIGFRWDAATRYIPTWMEIVVTLAIIFFEIWIFRWIVNRMPVLSNSRSER